MSRRIRGLGVVSLAFLLASCASGTTTGDPGGTDAVVGGEDVTGADPGAGDAPPETRDAALDAGDAFDAGDACDAADAPVPDVPQDLEPDAVEVAPDVPADAGPDEGAGDGAGPDDAGSDDTGIPDGVPVDGSVDDAGMEDVSTDDTGPIDVPADPGPAPLCGTKRLSTWSRSLLAVGGTVTFNEVMYHPAGDPRLEWVELHNPMAVDIDVSGWRLDGAVRYAFPEGTLVPARGYVVVAGNPGLLADALAFAGALGPWDGALNDDGAGIELRSNSGRLMDQVVYDDTEPWPVIPDGSGASLAKIVAEGSSEPAENWMGAGVIGGTPGASNLPGFRAMQGATLRFNEVAGGFPAPLWIELVNAGPAPIDAGGFVLQATGGASFVLPSQSLEPGALLLLDAAHLGFGANAGDKVFLVPPDRASVADGVEVMAVPRGRAVPGEDPWLYPDTATPGEPNRFVFHDDVVINEILYHHGPVVPAEGPVEASSEEWIELFNRGAAPVDLGGWQLVDDVEYEFPAGTTIEAGGYLVVARKAAALRAEHPAIAIVGDFQGKLANDGANVVLRDACGNPVDAVRYHDGGRWPSLAGGGGSSLELRDPRADNAAAEAWAASDESAAAAWQEFAWQGVAEPSAVGPDGQWQEFVVGLLDEGVVLLDDVSVVEDPDGTPIELIRDGAFESGAAAGWRLLGNHRHGEVVVDPSNPGNHVLRLAATGSTEHMHNHAETTLAGGRAIVDGRTYRISFKARWVAGSSLLNARLYFNRLARTVRVPMPELRGTPGAPNSTAVSNLGPTYARLQALPTVPGIQVPVTVSVEAADPDGVARMTLWYAVNDGPPTSVPMSTWGSGLYTARVPGQLAGAIVQFFVEGTDGLGASSFFPAGGPSSRALWKVADGLAATNGLHNFRIVLTPADADWLHDEVNVMSNDRVGATVIYDEREAFHDVGVRLKGSERGRSMPLRTGFSVHFHPDQPFRGVYRSVMVDRSQGVDFGQREMLINQVMSHAGSVHSEYDDLVQVIPPRIEHTGPAELQLARFGDLLLDSQFDQGSDGTRFEYELVYYPVTTDDGTPEGLKLPQPDRVIGTPIRDLGDDPEAYRYDFILKNNLWRDDYAALMAFAKVFGLTGAEFDARIGDFIDVDEWLRAFAFATLSGAVDNYASGAQHNADLFVRPSDGRVLYFPHDLDFYGGSPLSPVVWSPDLARLIATPANLRLYYGHLLDILQTSYNAAYMAYWCGHYGALLPGQDFAAYLQFIADRSEWVLNGAPDAVTKAIVEVPFEIATNGGTDFQTADDAVALDGTGWIDVREIRRAGDAVPLAATWADATTWSVGVPLECGVNRVALEALDLQGRVRGSDEISVTRIGGTCP